jgi:hypothetical protein
MQNLYRSKGWCREPEEGGKAQSAAKAQQAAEKP